MKLDFKLIDKQKLNTVLSLLKEAALWLKERNIDYWQDWHDPPENFKNWILKGLQNKQFYFIYDNYELIGMFRLQYNDELFWGKKDDKAAYIHSFTIKRTLSGKGIGYKVLNKLEEQLKTIGINYLRLDCGIHIKKLCDYYRNHGFKETGKVTVHGEELLLLEKLI